MEKGLRSKVFGTAFAILTIVSCGILLPGIQSNSFATAAKASFSIPLVWMAVLYGVLFAYVIFGGGKRIARTAELVVPFMAIGYILLAIVILFVHASRIPQVFGLIFSSAFDMNAVYGAVFGQAVSWGVKRGIFSNEAGQGTGAQAAGAAEVVPGFGGRFAPVALSFFTFTTVLAYAFYTDSNVGYLFRKNTGGAGYKVTLAASRVVLVAMVVVGTLSSADVVWNFGSAGVGAMAWFNVMVILLLTKPGIATLRDYEGQKKMGLDPVFVPGRPGIKDAELWHDIVERHYPQQLAALKEKERTAK